MKQPSNDVSRRGFFKLIGAGGAAGAAMASGSRAEAFEFLHTPEALPPDREVPTFCEVCYWKCGVVAEARKNNVLSLKGHPDYPNARGKLCARGHAGGRFATDPDRLKYPMIRVGKRGDAEFERVGWKVAYEYAAEKLQKVKDEYGPEALGMFYHGSGGSFFRSLAAAFGSPNYAAPAYAQCKGARDVAFKTTFGEKWATPEQLDYDNTKCMVLFGTHIGENAHNSQVQDFVGALRRGAKLIVLDPRLSVAASRADLWLPVKPGSDGAVILAWLHLLIKHGTYHALFVENQTVGFGELAAFVEPYTPAWAAAEAKVPEADIVAAYELMVEHMPEVLVNPGRHAAWYGQADFQRARAQGILMALLGAYWTKGANYRIEKIELADFPGPDYPDMKPNVDKAAGRFPLAPELTTTGVREATLTGKPYPIKAWYVHATNLIHSMPNSSKTIEAIEKLDFIGVSDILPSDITAYADVIFPESVYLERYDDLIVGATKTPYIALRQPVVETPYDTRPAWRIAKELATTMGLGDYFAYTNMEEYLETRLKPTGITLAELKKTGIHFSDKPQELYMEPTEEHEWHTASGKVELYSAKLEKLGIPPLPVYEAQPDPPEGKLRLLYGRSPVQTFSSTENNPILHDLMKGNCVWLNPVCAKKMGIEHGEQIMLVNDQGVRAGPMPARVTERMQEKAVYMIHGFGHRNKSLTLSCCLGGSDSDLLDNYGVDPVTGATGMRTEFVSIARSDGKGGYSCAQG